ncbi:hypothetical protein GCM10010972_20460 [Cellulomonas carbonis]|nr:hypothetical protein GCM10010972_20460 [Cellulomonas carbonis]
MRTPLVGDGRGLVDEAAQLLGIGVTHGGSCDSVRWAAAPVGTEPPVVPGASAEHLVPIESHSLSIESQ